MSTRGCIAVGTIDNFEGRYHHSDSYPTSLGATLWELYRGHFRKDLEAMVKFLIEDHPAGWSTINNRNFDLEPGFIDLNSEQGKKLYTPPYDEKLFAATPPACYCHGDRKESAQLITHKTNGGDCGLEFLYILNIRYNTISIFEWIYKDDGSHATGMFGFGPENAHWKHLRTADLNGRKPGWKSMCHMFA